MQHSHVASLSRAASETESGTEAAAGSAHVVIAPLKSHGRQPLTGSHGDPACRSNRSAASAGMALTKVGLPTKRIAQASCAAPTCTTSIAPVQTLPKLSTVVFGVPPPCRPA